MNKDCAIIGNAVASKISAIPVVDIKSWRNFIVETCQKAGGRLVALFGNKDSGSAIWLYAIVGVDSKSQLYISSTHLQDKKYSSLTPELMQAHLFERELIEEFGIIPEGHPWPKPVRDINRYKCSSMEDEAFHEVAVGPVHAGVIEPGHFRFQCHGEKVFNLEIHLGYQRRGVEKLFLKSSSNHQMILAESIAGDTSIGHGLAYCHVVEGLAERQVSQRARIIRAFALEVERIANHIGDLGALANDVGFLPAASYFGRLRAEFLNILLKLNGSRYGRGLLKPGGIAFDITHEILGNFKERLDNGAKEARDLIELLFSTDAVVTRFSKTGVVSQCEAENLGLVGLSARACNLLRDVRRDYPCGMYRYKKIIPVKTKTGDVYARARVRALEIKGSIEFAAELLNSMPVEKVYFPCAEARPSSFVVSMTEGWRGEIVHIAFTDENGKIVRYKIIDPSFHNWSGLEAALRNGQISDFPLCNKSFNLSYAGYDL